MPLARMQRCINPNCRMCGFSLLTISHTCVACGQPLALHYKPPAEKKEGK